MALVIKDRVRETTTTTGTGTITLAGAVTGYQSFGTAIGSTNTTFYTIAGQGTSEWEVGLGTVGSGTLARTTVLASSNSGSAVNFSAGTKDVFGTYPAGRAVASTGALTSGRVTYATTDGAVTDSANFTFNGTTVTTANDASISTLTVGRGGNGSLSSTTAVGVGVLGANINGGRHTGVGYQALKTNNGGGSNTAIGYSSMQADTTSFNNVAVGTETLYYNTSGSYNVAIGSGSQGSSFGALGNNTASNFNTAVGNRAMYSHTSAVATLGAITGGSGYTNGTYYNVQLTLSSGTAAGTYPIADIVVSGGAVTTVTLKTFGTRFVDTTTVLTAPAASIGGTGSGFSVPVATLNSGNTYNTALGAFSLYSNTTAANNVAIGGNALYFNTTGASNTATGYQALYINTFGANNTAFGYQSLLNSTSGVNTFSGLVGGSGYVDGTYNGVQLTYLSGTAVLSGGTYPTANITVSGGSVTTVTVVTNGTRFVDLSTRMSAASASLGGTGSGFSIGIATLATGANNTAVGYQALQANTTASQNVALGYRTLLSNTTGSSNTGLGYQALNGITTGSNNVAVGNNAAYSATSASFVTYVGNGAGQSNTGSNNTGIGAHALSTAGAGYNNTAVGYFALNALTSGANNTAFGHQAGYTGTNNLTTGSNNILIGYLAAPSSATVSNEITLGNSSITSLRLAPLITGYTSAAPTIASAATIAPTKPIVFVSGTTTIDTITAPAPLTGGGGSITIIPTGLWSTSTAGNIALATTAVVNKALILTYDATTTKWYPSY